MLKITAELDDKKHDVTVIVDGSGFSVCEFDVLVFRLMKVITETRQRLNDAHKTQDGRINYADRN